MMSDARMTLRLELYVAVTGTPICPAFQKVRNRSYLILVQVELREVLGDSTSIQGVIGGHPSVKQSAECTVDRANVSYIPDLRYRNRLGAHDRLTATN
jgi:hypothetical protein